jgi:hypothetical protein
MEPSRTLELFADAIDYMNGTRRTYYFEQMEHRCGKVATRLALTRILDWLRYIYRGGRERTHLALTPQKAPLASIQCLLTSGEGFSLIFELQGSNLVWSQAVSQEARLQIVNFVGEHWPIVVRE